MVFEKVRDMIASQLQVDASTITPESRLVEDLKADSANVMVMILELESEFGIEVEDEVILTLKTVGDVVDYIEKHQSRPPGIQAPPAAHPLGAQPSRKKGASSICSVCSKPWAMPSGTRPTCAWR